MTEISEALAFFDIAGYIATICGISAILAALLPPAKRTSPAWWKHTRRILDVLAANFRSAKNRMR